MMWPIFWPDDTDFSDPSNTRHPSEDVNAAAKYIGEQVAAVVAAAGTSDDPQGYGQAVARELFPDVLSYMVGTPAVYGFAGRNGRTLADNAPEAMLSLVTNTAVPSGLSRPSRRTSGPAPSLRRPGLTAHQPDPHGAGTTLKRKQMGTCWSGVPPTAGRTPATSAAMAAPGSPRPCWWAAVPPLMLKTDANPGGLPIETFDAIRDGLLQESARSSTRTCPPRSMAPTGPVRTYRRACGTGSGC